MIWPWEPLTGVYRAEWYGRFKTAPLSASPSYSETSVCEVTPGTQTCDVEFITLSATGGFRSLAALSRTLNGLAQPPPQEGGAVYILPD